MSSNPCLANVRVMPRNGHCIETWYVMVENYFTMLNITSNVHRYTILQHQLDSEDSRRVADILRCPVTEESYALLKDALISRCGASKDDRMRKMLENEPLGDRTPSEFLTHLKVLGAESVSNSFMQTIWLDRLPANIQAILAAQPDASLENLALIADAIHRVSNPNPAIRSVTPSQFLHVPEPNKNPWEKEMAEMRQLLHQVLRVQ